MTTLLLSDILQSVTGATFELKMLCFLNTLLKKKRLLWTNMMFSVRILLLSLAYVMLVKVRPTMIS